MLNSEAQRPESPALDADRASWLQARLRSFATLAQVLGSFKGRAVTADEEMYSHALEGAVRGQAREIARTLGFTSGENLESWISYERGPRG